MSIYEKPIPVSYGNYGILLAAPIKSGAMIKVFKESYSRKYRGSSAEWIRGKLEYRNRLGDKELYPLYAGVRWGLDEDDWDVILDGNIVELAE